MSDLNRFIKAQEGVYETALSEIKAGNKTSHWMWYISPQIRGLERSGMSYKYGIKDRKEADDYLNHPILGKRLKEISAELLKLKNSNPTAILGTPDDMKLKSCMTLFNEVIEDETNIFNEVLQKFYYGTPDKRTKKILNNFKNQ